MKYFGALMLFTLYLSACQEHQKEPLQASQTFSTKEQIIDLPAQQEKEKEKEKENNTSLDSHEEPSFKNSAPSSQQVIENFSLSNKCKKERLYLKIYPSQFSILSKNLNYIQNKLKNYAQNIYSNENYNYKFKLRYLEDLLSKQQQSLSVDLKNTCLYSNFIAPQIKKLTQHLADERKDNTSRKEITSQLINQTYQRIINLNNALKGEQK